jgi:hypothetical protein
MTSVQDPPPGKTFFKKLNSKSKKLYRHGLCQRW